jgi:serine/threonine-protein kinase HipA
VPEPGIRAEAEVRLWSDTVGALVELDNGRVIFEYADSFVRGGLEISPIHLPTEQRGPVSFDELRNLEAFEGLPGVFADALPDAFGRRVIRAFYAARGETRRALSPVQRLLYVGNRAIGALTFHPTEEIPSRLAERESLDLQQLTQDAQRIVRGDPEIEIPEIYRIGSSAGGRRPKAIVHYNADQRSIRSGGTVPAQGEVPCILKFDGVGDGASEDELGRPMHYNRVEAAYGDMARAAGLETTRIEVLEVNGYAHLLIHRFDSREGRRLHQHTLGGMIHVDYNQPLGSSYEEYFRTVLQLGMAYDALTEAYRRMVFNVLAVNQDDHVKNLSFQMDPEGTWSLSPAYDLTFAHGVGFTATHQMTVRNKATAIGRTDLLELAREFGVKQPERILEQTATAIADWERFAAAYEVSKHAVHAIRKELDASSKHRDS